MILQQHTHILLSANRGSYWDKSTVDHSVIDFFYKILKTTKCMFDLVRTVILNLISFAANISMSGIALQTSMPTKHFLGQMQEIYILYG